jgi:hypothetical protein
MPYSFTPVFSVKPEQVSKKSKRKGKGSQQVVTEMRNVRLVLCFLGLLTFAFAVLPEKVSSFFFQLEKAA